MIQRRSADNEAGLSALLPTYYRAHPELLEPILSVASEQVRAVSRQTDRLKGIAGDQLVADIALRWLSPLLAESEAEAQLAAPQRRGAGSREEFVAWWRSTWGHEPRLWTGYLFHPDRDGSLTLGVSRAPAVAILWGRERFPPDDSQHAIPPELIPLQTRLQVVVPQSEEGWKAPVPRRRYRGHVLWDSGRSIED